MQEQESRDYSTQESPLERLLRQTLLSPTPETLTARLEAKEAAFLTSSQLRLKQLVHSPKCKHLREGAS